MLWAIVKLGQTLIQVHEIDVKGGTKSCKVFFSFFFHGFHINSFYCHLFFFLYFLSKILFPTSVVEIFLLLISTFSHSQLNLYFCVNFLYDRREKVKRRRAQLAKEAADTPPEAEADRKQEKPDLVDLSKDLPSGWQVQIKTFSHDL